MSEFHTRPFELFHYTHSQLLRRAAIERSVQDLPDIVPLDSKAIDKRLGPGYKEGFFAWQGLGGRKNNCKLSWKNRKSYKRMAKIVEKELSTDSDFEYWAEGELMYFHAYGHMYISNDCTPRGYAFGMMGFSETSARDPVFYRLHTHIDNIVQRFRNKKLPSYIPSDFQLSDNLRVYKVETVIDKEHIGWLSDGEDVKNVLVTFNQVATISHHLNSDITYKRINHLPFSYRIAVSNPLKSTKKVIVRIWLGLLNKSGTKLESNRVIELDRFVYTLDGNSMEIIDRKSTDSAATMKDQISTIERLDFT